VEFVWLEMVDEAMAAALQPRAERAHEARRTGT